MWAAATPPAQPGGAWFLVFVAVMTCIGGGGGITALVLVASQRRKNRADTRKAEADGAQAISNAAVGLLKPLEEQVARVERDNRSLQQRLGKADRRLSEQAETIDGLREDNRSLRALLRRITATVTSVTALADPSPTVLAVRQLVADNPHHTE
jgi:uncharacterized protein HemX